MANNKKSQSPEELGQAVGKKIEELFGGMFDDGPAPPAAANVAEPAPTPARDPAPAAGPAQSMPAPAPVASRRVYPTPAHAPELIDRIEAQVLQLEWEVTDQNLRDLQSLFTEMEKSVRDDTIRILLNMNVRVLQNVAGSGVTPHPSLLKFLQDSVILIRRAVDTGGREMPEPSNLAELKGRYQQIMAASDHPSAAQALGKDTDYQSIVQNIGGSVRSLSEISQRLSRILAVFRQGGDMSGEEITRRLGTLEKLLAEHVESLTGLHGELSSTSPSPSAGDDRKGPDGVLMVACGTSPLAIPSSSIVALYPLTKEQASPLVGKASITLGRTAVPRLPLKLPQDKTQKVMPTVLVHMSLGPKDYFLLADRSLGYRSVPPGADVMNDGRIKLGPTSYSLINQAAFRSGP